MKSGFISIIGRTNAGKSALMNSLLGEKIALVSHKQNATRRQIKAIVMHGQDQIILIDTPGLHESKAIFNQFLIKSALRSLSDCDAILFVASIFDRTKNYEDFLNLNPKVPHIIALNKVDLANNEVLLKKLDEYAKFSEHFHAILPYSYKKKIYKKQLLDQLCKLLPEHEHFYNSQFLSANTQKDIFKDLILESIYKNLNEELPYCCELMIRNIKQTHDRISIELDIITDTKSHKAILIGKAGATLKRIAKDARFKINKLTQKKVFVQFYVLIKKNWQRDENFIKKILNFQE